MTEIIQFVDTNVWSFIALMPAAIVVILARAVEGTSFTVIDTPKPKLWLRVPTALRISFTNSNRDFTWNLRE